MDPSPLWMQGGELGLAAIVVILTARMIAIVMRGSGDRERYFFEQMAQQRDQFSGVIDRQQAKFAALLEQQQDKYSALTAEEQKQFSELSAAFNKMADSFVDIADRLEAIELKAGFHRRARRAADKDPNAPQTE